MWEISVLGSSELEFARSSLLQSPKTPTDKNNGKLQEPKMALVGDRIKSNRSSQAIENNNSIIFQINFFS